MCPRRSVDNKALILSYPILLKKKGRSSSEVNDDCRGQLGHLQSEMVHVLACFPISIEFIDLESLKQTATIISSFSKKILLNKFRVN